MDTADPNYRTCDQCGALVPSSAPSFRNDLCGTCDQPAPARTLEWYDPVGERWVPMGVGRIGLVPTSGPAWRMGTWGPEPVP